MKTIIKEYGKKLLSLVMAAVMTLTLVNLAPFAQEAKAATTSVYIYMADDVGAAAPKTNVYGGAGGTTGWAEPSDYSQYKDTDNGTWYLTTKYNFDTGNTVYVFKADMTQLGSAQVSNATADLYIVADSTGVQIVTEEVANNTYGLGSGSGSAETFTFTFVDGTSDRWLSNAGATFQVVADGTTYNMSGGSGTWTADLPASAANLVINRKAPAGGTWNSWTTGDRGDNTTFTATSDVAGVWSGAAGAGYPDVVVTDISWSPASPKAGDAVTFTATIKNQGTVATPAGKTGVAFTVNGGSKTWNGDYTASIPAGGSITLTANNGDSGSTWTASAGTFNVTAEIDDTGYTESDTSNNSYSKNITVAEATTPIASVITFVSQNTGIQADDARIYVIEGTIESGSYKDGNNIMTKGTAMTKTADGTWTATVTSDVITFVRVSRASNGNYYWGLAWENTSRGTETVFTATANGQGYWGEASEQPTTEAPAGGIYGTPFTETQLWDMSHLELDDVVDANTASQQELFVVPGIFYNYKPSGGSSWWNQFKNLDAAIVDNYYGTDKMEYPLVIGAPDTMWVSGDNQGQRPLSDLMNGKVNTDITDMMALYYVNHNLTGDGNGTSNGIGSGSAVVQGLVAEYLNNDGKLLSSENNVIMPFFDDNFLGTTGEGTMVDGTWATKYGSKENPLSFPFRIDGDYYIFDSASGTDNIRVENESIVYDSSSGAQVKNGFANYTGFYPFSTSAASGNSAALTYGFGARLDIPFNVVNGDASKATPTVASKTASISWNNTNVQTWTVDLGTTLTAGQTYTIVLDSDMGGGITWDSMGIDGQNKYFADKSWYTVEGSTGYKRVDDINNSSDCLSSINGKIVMSITPASNISSFTLHGKTYDSNYNLGVSVYAVAPDKIVYPPEDIVFNFTGDDDLWVYVDGKLVLDMGGAHGQASGSINFTDGTVTVNDAYVMNYATNQVSGTGVTTTNVDWIKFDDPSVNHTMTVFYMERGLYDSNLKISFNFNPVKLTQRNGLTVSNKVDLSDINNGFLTDLDAYDFDFTYDAYDVTDYLLSENKDLLFDGGTITITGDGSKTAYLEQEHTDGTGTIRGDEAKVTQNQNDNFNTSYDLIDTSGNIINSSTSDNPYNVVDGKITSGETEDVYFELEDGSSSDSNLHIEAAFKNKAKVTSVTIGKLDNSIAHAESDQYTFIVEYTKLLGVAKTGFFTGEYTITDTRDSSVRTASTSNGEITIYAYEEVTINGVPVGSEIRISEKNDGNYIKTVVTTSESAELEIDNDEFYSITSDADVTYDWQIINGDKNTAVYFAEVGTPVIINCGDELANIQLSSTTTTGEFRYQVEVPADTITVNAPNQSPVTGGADLVITDISWGGTDIAVGDEVIFTVTVKNVGDTAIPANEVIGLDIIVDGNENNKLWCDTYANGLAAGATVTLTINGGTAGSVWTATNGSHTFRANIDNREKFTEVNESNNYYEITLTTPYEAGGVEQRVSNTTYSYHEEIIAGTVSGTIGTVTHTKDSITYTYPGNKAPGDDIFYYEVVQIADSDVVVNNETIVRAGDIYYRTSTAARVYSYKGNDDVYVIDYGLPVSLTAEPNNMRANDITTFADVATYLVEYGFIGADSVLSGTAAAKGIYKAAQIGYITAGSAVYGGVAANGTDAAGLNNWNYSLTKFMNGIETFYYGFQVVAEGTDAQTATLNAANATPIMNSKVTVVPASIVYYEDNFSYSSSTGTTSAITYTGEGVVVNNTGLDITQSNSLDDIYGFDNAYDSMIGDGLGSTVLEKSQKVSFTFKGTGFDIVARTADTATVLYVVSCEGQLVQMGNVDTYYDAGTLYQLPVISVKDLAYNEYTVQFMILSSSSYSQFYFDGIRIYNPLGAGSDYYNSYENGAKATPVIDMILGDCTFTESGIYDAEGNLIESANTVPAGSQISVVGGAITEDLGNATIKTGASLADLLSHGPNEEVYLGSSSKLVFYAEKNDEVTNDADRTLQVEVKAVSTNGTAASSASKDTWSVIDTNSDTANTYKMFDGVIGDSDAYRWTSYTAMASATEASPVYFVVDLGRSYKFDTVQMFLGTSANDQPDNYKISVSNNNAVWTVVDSGSAASGKEEYSVGSQNARYIKVEAWGGSNYWSVHEFGIANNGVAAGTGLDLTLNSTRDVIASIGTNTAMYYEIPMSMCALQPDGRYLVVINGASDDIYSLSFTNLKVKGYDITPYEAATTASSIYITDVTVGGSSNISFNRKTQVEFAVTLSEDADMNKNNFSLTANGKNVTIRSVEAVEGTSNQYIVKTLAPNAIGTFTYNFAYTNADGKVSVTSVNARVTASRSR